MNSEEDYLNHEEKTILKFLRKRKAQPEPPELHLQAVIALFLGNKLDRLHEDLEQLRRILR